MPLEIALPLLLKENAINIQPDFKYNNVSKDWKKTLSFGWSGNNNINCTCNLGFEPNKDMRIDRIRVQNDLRSPQEITHQYSMTGLLNPEDLRYVIFRFRGLDNKFLPVAIFKVKINPNKHLPNRFK